MTSELTLNKYNNNLINQEEEDLSNISDTGEETITNLATPSTSYTTLTVGSTGTTYTAPADGFFNFGGTAGVTTITYLRLRNVESGMISEVESYGAMNAVPYIFLPVKKGNTVAITYSVQNTCYLRFYPLGD